MTSQPNATDIETLEREAFARSTEKLPLSGRDVGPRTWHDIGFRAGFEAANSLNNPAKCGHSEGCSWR